MKTINHSVLSPRQYAWQVFPLPGTLTRIISEVKWKCSPNIHQRRVVIST